MLRIFQRQASKTPHNPNNERLVFPTFQSNQTYQPRDLHPTVPFVKAAPTGDILAKLNMDPIKNYKNTLMLSYFVDAVGRILPQRDSGLSTAHQKKIGKMIKRARAMGMLPFTYKMH